MKQLKKDAKAAKQNFILYGMGKVMPEPEYDLPLNAEGDAAIYVVSRISGEGNDRTPLKGDIRLTDSEVRDILALDKKFTRFMLVLNVGGVVDLPRYERAQHSAAVPARCRDRLCAGGYSAGQGQSLRQTDDHLGRL